MATKGVCELCSFLAIFIPTLLKKKQREYCKSLRPSVRLPVMLSPPKPWTKFNQVWCVSYSHEWGVQRQFFWPRPLGPWGGVKRSNIIKFQLQSQFQRFLFQTLCVFSQMKDTRAEQNASKIFIIWSNW